MTITEEVSEAVDRLNGYEYKDMNRGVPLDSTISILQEFEKGLLTALEVLNHNIRLVTEVFQHLGKTMVHTIGIDETKELCIAEGGSDSQLQPQKIRPNRAVSNSLAFKHKNNDAFLYSTVLEAADTEILNADEKELSYVEKNVVSWTVIVVAYARCGYLNEARELFEIIPELLQSIA
ncbi:hypothetical protein SUGI_0449590 [Cryptomeria japonica]|nr:hypothetical protein SUGI_0449590 [Cryptomeria japonica]